MWITLQNASIQRCKQGLRVVSMLTSINLLLSLKAELCVFLIATIRLFYLYWKNEWDNLIGFREVTSCWAVTLKRV